MNNKPNILIFIDWFLPGFKAGGPIKSVCNIVNALHNDFNFFIVTSDRDLNDKKAYENVKFNEWVKTDNYSIIYLTAEKRKDWIKDHLMSTVYHYYYFNSIFSNQFTLSPLLLLKKLNLSNKSIIAPRGMLGKGALSIKPFKKQLFLTAAKLLGYFNGITWHTTNQGEHQDVIAVFGNSIKSKIASNISFNVIIPHSLLKEKGNVKLVFFSRISPKKNLKYALRLIIGLENISLDIYGSIEDDTYWSECNKLIIDNNLNANYKGEILPINVTETLSNYHFTLFPTLHENYGHVIVEALTAGCGLIMSNNTPWRELNEKKIGWDINLDDKTKFIDVLKHCLIMEQDEYSLIRNNCYSFVENEINTDKEIEDTKNLFKTS